MEEFKAVPDHINFLAKKLFGPIEGEILDGAIAYLEKEGGGPVENHTHKHNHLFTVIEGEAIIVLGQERIILKKNESYLVKGEIPHSTWNNRDEVTVMLGISIMP